MWGGGELACEREGGFPIDILLSPLTQKKNKKIFTTKKRSLIQTPLVNCSIKPLPVCTDLCNHFL